jgi:hypothetical protein
LLFATALALAVQKHTAVDDFGVLNQYPLARLVATVGLASNCEVQLWTVKNNTAERNGLLKHFRQVKAEAACRDTKANFAAQGIHLEPHLSQMYNADKMLEVPIKSSDSHLHCAPAAKISFHKKAALFNQKPLDLDL